MDGQDPVGRSSAGDFVALNTATMMRRRPHMFLGTDTLTPEVEAGRVVAAALVCGAPAMVVERVDAPSGPWLIVRSSADWLPAKDPLSAFGRLLDLPVEDPIHHMGHRPEVFLTAYAADVVTTSGPGHDLVVVKGAADAALRAHLEAVLRTEPVGRLVAFRGADPCVRLAGS